MEVVSRQEFCRELFHYKPGQHVLFGGPSTKGKTRLAFDLLEYAATEDCPAYVAQSKPTDLETDRGAKRLDFRTVNDWPVPRKVGEMLGGDKPRGYVIKPRFGNLDTDMANCAAITARLLDDRYTAGVKGKKGILVMDDTMVKAKILNLDGQMVTIIAMAGAMGIGEWVFVQKPTDSGRITLWSYENYIHGFFTKGGDRRMLLRYAEIAGDRGQLLVETVPTLTKYQFAYLHKDEGWYCIVDRGELWTKETWTTDLPITLPRVIRLSGMR
jgi:hypothetical protein